MTEMIAAEGLKKVFGDKVAVAGVSLTVDRGEVLGFLGPNGAGKSTTMRMLVGYLRPTEGRARICGADVQDAAVEARRHLGYLPEGAPLYPDMTASAFLGFIADMRGLAGAERKRRIGAAIEMTHLEEVLMQPIETLSKGFKRRVGLAQALLHDPDVLILDEPTDGLDPNQKHEVRSLIRTIAPRKAIIISTHILEEVEAVCTRAVIIAAGKVVADGTPLELSRRSRFHGAVSLVVAEEVAPGAEAAIRGLGSVLTVEVIAIGGAQARITAFPRVGQEIYPNVSQLVHAHGWTVADLRAETGHLDDVFRNITGGPTGSGQSANA